METQIIRIEDNDMESGKLQEAAQIIRDGGLVAFPTETVYGLGGNALNPEAAQKIYEAKGRPSDNPLIVHIESFQSLERITTGISQKARDLAERFWPGPLTMIFEKNEMIPFATTGGLDTVAVRMPDHPLALAMIKASTGYIAAPSANTSGKPSPTTAVHVYNDLKGRIPMILDGGPVGIGIESTIVDFSEGVPTILRPGYITMEMIQNVIGEVRMDPGLIFADADIRPKAPGMKYRHYAPKAEMILVKGEREAVTDKINCLAKEAVRQGKRVGIIATDETCSSYGEGIVKIIGARSRAESVAKHMYGILREFDELDVDIIYSESFPETGIGHAVMNRMRKAAGHHVLEV